MLLGWLVILVTGCLKMEAVCLTGRAVFKSGLPCGDTRAAPGPPGARLPCPLPPRPWHPEARPGPGPARLLPYPCLLRLGVHAAWAQGHCRTRVHQGSGGTVPLKAPCWAGRCDRHVGNSWGPCRGRPKDRVADGASSFCVSVASKRLANRRDFNSRTSDRDGAGALPGSAGCGAAPAPAGRSP